MTNLAWSRSANIRQSHIDQVNVVQNTFYDVKFIGGYFWKGNWIFGVFSCSLALDVWYYVLLLIQSSFFLNDICQIANLPKSFVMFKWWHNESVNVYFWTFINEIFYLLMYKYIYKPTRHRQIPEMPWAPPI